MKERREVNFAVVEELATFVATLIGYVTTSNRNRGQASPRLLLAGLGLMSKKTWDGAITAKNKGLNPMVLMDVEDWAHTFAMGEKADTVAEWIMFAKLIQIGAKAKAILLADAFVNAIKADGMRLDRIETTWLEQTCQQAGVDFDMLLLACIGYVPKNIHARKYVRLGAYTSKQIPEGFMERNFYEIDAICNRMAYKATFNAGTRRDAVQDMWEATMKYGGRIIEAETVKGTSDEEILHRLGGYLRACIPAVRAKYDRRSEVSFARGEDYREDADKNLTDPYADTEMQAILGGRTLEELCEEYGADPETVRALLAEQMKKPE